MIRYCRASAWPEHEPPKGWTDGLEKDWSEICAVKCFFINLDRATSRRETIQRTFSSLKPRDLRLERFAAIDVAHVREKNVQGKLTEVEKACFLSHSTIVKANTKQNENVWILEDDQTFSAKTFGLVSNFFETKSQDLEWDLMYTDVGISSIGVMADLFRYRRDLMRKNSIECLNLQKMPFFGATSYIINRKSIAKIASFMEETTLDIPYDLLLRKLIYEGKLNGFVTFPFLTTDSDEAANSSIQKSEFAQTDLIWSLFRRLTWLDGDSFDPTPLLNGIWSGLDKRSQLYGVLWAAMADPGFKTK